jgi:hypothetical protein
VRSCNSVTGGSDSTPGGASAITPCTENARRRRTREGAWRATGEQGKQLAMQMKSIDEPRGLPTVEPSLFAMGQGCQDWSTRRVAISKRHNDGSVQFSRGSGVGVRKKCL